MKHIINHMYYMIATKPKKNVLHAFPFRTRDYDN